jgi:hypothetical protein
MTKKEERRRKKKKKNQMRQLIEVIFSLPLLVQHTSKAYCQQEK